MEIALHPLDVACAKSEIDDNSKVTLLQLSENLKQTNPARYQEIKEEIDTNHKLIFETADVATNWDDSNRIEYDTELDGPKLQSKPVIEVDLNLEYHQFEMNQKYKSGNHVTTVSLADDTAQNELRRKELHIKLKRMRATSSNHKFEAGKVHCQLKVLSSHTGKQKTIGQTEYIEAKNTDTLGWSHIFVIQGVTRESLADAYIILDFQEKGIRGQVGRQQSKRVGMINLSDKGMVHSMTREFISLHEIMEKGEGVDVSLPVRCTGAGSGKVHWKKAPMKLKPFTFKSNSVAAPAGNPICGRWNSLPTSQLSDAS